MARLYTLDASVLINAFNPHEAGHEASRRLLSILQAQSLPILAPALIIPETAAAIRRGRGDAALAMEFAAALARFPGMSLIPLDAALALEAAQAAAEYDLQGSEAVYVAVAMRFGSSLVTLDREQRKRAASAVPVHDPAEALA